MEEYLQTRMPRATTITSINTPANPARAEFDFDRARREGFDIDEKENIYFGEGTIYEPVKFLNSKQNPHRAVSEAELVTAMIEAINPISAPYSALGPQFLYL
jgi:hypothetical protein